MNVPHEPVKYVDVTVHTDVNVFKVFAIREVLFKILHICNKNVPVALEVLIPFLVFIADMNDYLISQVAVVSAWRNRSIKALGMTLLWDYI